MGLSIRKLKRALFNSDSSFCDMYEDAGARLNAEEYLAHIRYHIKKCFGEVPISILDAGCQSGRLLIPLAEEGHQMSGIDASIFSLRRCRLHGKAKGVKVALRRMDIARLRCWVKPLSLDAVVCTEVLYLCQNHRQLLQLLSDSVKPGGLLFVSHRPALYYVASALRQNQLHQASSLARLVEGCSPDGEYHNWQTKEQLMDLYKTVGLETKGFYPIGTTHVQLNNWGKASVEAKQILSPACLTGSLFGIPTYVLVVAQRGGS